MSFGLRLSRQPAPPRRVVCCCRRCTALLIATIAGTPVSDAHQAQSDWSYPLACCHGDTNRGECQNIPGSAVVERDGGWTIVLNPGDHRKVTHPNRYFVPYGSEIPSQDGQYHICLHPTEEHENCFFVPPGAM